jgi:hypothetical protein
MKEPYLTAFGKEAVSHKAHLPFVQGRNRFFLVKLSGSWQTDYRLQSDHPE